MDEDIKYILYFILAIIYFVARALRKKKPVRRPAPTSEPSSSPESTDPEVTFEDLLREFGADIPKKEKTPPPLPEPVMVDDDKAREVYLKSVESAQKRQAAETSSHSQGLKFERDDHYKIMQDDNLLGERLQNPETLKEAIIFSEILNRKYD